MQRLALNYQKPLTGLRQVRLAGCALSVAALFACQSVPEAPVVVETAPPVVQATVEVAPEPGEIATLVVDGERRQVTLSDFDFSGTGTLIKADGTRLHGRWLNGQLHGYGESSAQGNAYRGNWQHGERHGRGTQLLESGFSYQGNWQNDKREGYGTLTYPNQVYYEGMWHAGKKSGYGLEQRPDFSSHKGEWRNDVQHGPGITTFSDGTQLAGTWVDGEISGEAELTTPLGVQIRGMWRAGAIRSGVLQLPDGGRYSGEIYLQRGLSYNAAFVEWLDTQAHNNSAYAQYLLANAHLEARVPNPDLRAGAAWLERAAAQGLAAAQYELAMLLVEQDWEQAETLLQAAVEQGYPAAYSTLAEYYHQGYHYPQDLALAVRYYQAAVDAGHLNALNNYAWLLATTDSSWADPEEAIRLMRPLILYLDNWQLLDTFAAAQARLGKYELAVSLQKRVIAAARADNHPQDIVFELENRLASYQDGQPFLQP